MLRLAAGSCSREIRPLLLAFQLHFTAPHICCESYFSAFFPPQANTALFRLRWLSLTAQPSFLILYPQQIQIVFLLSSTLPTVCNLFCSGLFNSEGAEAGQETETQKKKKAESQAERHTVRGCETVKQRKGAACNNVEQGQTQRDKRITTQQCWQGESY